MTYFLRILLCFKFVSLFFFSYAHSTSCLTYKADPQYTVGAQIAFGSPDSNARCGPGEAKVYVFSDTSQTRDWVCLKQEDCDAICEDTQYSSGLDKASVVYKCVKRK